MKVLRSFVQGDLIKDTEFKVNISKNTLSSTSPSKTSSGSTKLLTAKAVTVEVSRKKKHISHDFQYTTGTKAK